MINNRTIEVIENSDVFKKNVSIMTSTMGIDRQEAEATLLYDLFMNRLDHDINEMDTATSKSIVFSRKDCQREQFKEIEQRADNEVELDNQLVENMTDTISDNGYLKDYEIDYQKFNLIVSLFHSTQQNFVARLLLTGEDDTMKFFDDSQKVFNQKLARVERYARTHQGKFRAKLLTPYDLELQSMSDAIDKFFELYEAQPDLISNKELTKYFTAHQDMYPFSEAFDKVSYQGKLFDNWRGYTERTDFLLELNYQQQVLLDQIAVRKAERGY